MKYLIYAISLLMITSCQSEKSEESSLHKSSFDKLSRNEIMEESDHLTFRYTINSTRSKNNKGRLDLECELINDNFDTLYFITHSCFGWQNNFIIDTNEVQIHQDIMCNVSKPIVKKIAPRTRFKFNGHFLLVNQQRTKIDLQYYIYRVDRSFDITNTDSIRKLKKTLIKNV